MLRHKQSFGAKLCLTRLSHSPLRPVTTSFPLLRQFVRSFGVRRRPSSSARFGHVSSVPWGSTVTGCGNRHTRHTFGECT
jgi:hypothetical protein